MLKSEFSSFVSAYQQANLDIKGIIDGPVIVDFVDQHIGKYPNISEYRRDLIDLIADVVLGLISLRAATENLSTDKVTQKIFTDASIKEVTDFISKIRSTQHISDSLTVKQEKLPANVRTEEKELTQSEAPSIEIPNRPSVIITPPIPVQPTPEPTLVETKKEERYAQVKPIRTFAMDVDISRAHSYGATAQPNTEGEEEEPVHRSNQDDILKK